MPRPRKDNLELWQRYRATRSDDDRNALIVAYLPLCESIAGGISRALPTRAVFDLPALVNAGVPGLIEAIEAFDPQRGYYFSTFAHMRVKGAILDELRRYDWVPRLERTRAKRGEVQVNYQQPFVLEIDANGNETAYGQQFPDLSPGPEARQGSEDFWREWLRGLSQAERLIVLLYFREGLSMKQVGDQVGVSESRVSQQMSAICRRLRSRQEGTALTDKLPRKWRAKRGRPRVLRIDTPHLPEARGQTPELSTALPATRGRPAKAPDDRRTAKLMFRCTVEELQALKAHARSLGKPHTTWAREALLSLLDWSA